VFEAINLRYNKFSICIPWKYT